MEYLFNFIYQLPAKSFTLVAVLLGFILIDDLPADKQNVLGSFLSLIGDVISTNATQQNYIDEKENDCETKKIIKEIEQLKEQIKKLEAKTMI